jgi:hypothetical protein
MATPPPNPFKEGDAKKQLQSLNEYLQTTGSEDE